MRFKALDYHFLVVAPVLVLVLVPPSRPSVVRGGGGGEGCWVWLAGA